MRTLLVILFSVSTIANGQNYPSYWGYTAGITCSFGTKVNRLGLNVGGYYTYAIGQVNAQANWYYNFQSMGQKRKGSEFQLGAGLEVGFGRPDTNRNLHVGLTENNMEHVYSFGYSFIKYWDKFETSQESGIFTFNFTDFKFAYENDLFGGKGWRDAWRTGAALFEYQYDQTKFAIATTMWTSNYSKCRKVGDTDYPARFGYRDDSNVTPGGVNRSVSLLAIRVQHLLPYGQMPRTSIGIDTEHVRNLLQNKIFHNARYFPEKVIKHPQYHIPMLQDDGSQYLYQEGQKVKKPSFYFNLGINNLPFY